jgi:kynurenine formamidase
MTAARESGSSVRVIDLSHALDATTPPFPGDPPLAVEVVDTTARPARDGERPVNLSRIALGLHAGTHIDAPFHFFAQGETVDRVALERCFGPATLARLSHAGGARDGTIEPRHLEPFEARIRGTRRLLVETGWWRRWKSPQYFHDHAVLSADAARYLVGCGVVLVGVDLPSVDQAPYPAHVELLGSGVLIVENLTRLDELRREVFDFYAVPLKVAGRDGSPVRAFAVETA